MSTSNSQTGVWPTNPESNTTTAPWDANSSWSPFFGPRPTHFTTPDNLVPSLSPSNTSASAFQPSYTKSTVSTSPHTQTPSSSASPKSMPSPDDHASASTATSTTQPNKVQKRTLNTLAARRYRQKRVDQMSTLEIALKEVEKERNELRLRVAGLEAEVGVLRGLVKGS